jgi:serine/threonine protein kinase
MPTGSIFEVTSCVVAGAACVRKRIVAALADQPGARDALVREAQLLALTRHPAVPRLVEVGKDEAGAFVVEEAVVGLTLAELCDRYNGRVPLLLALHVAREAARNLGELHALTDETGPLALVHGDPSPDNVMLTSHGTIRFVDFGGASYRGAPELVLRQHGTPPYAAPELLRGEARPDRVTDAHALAAALIVLLTGESVRPEAEASARLLRAAEVGLDLGPLRRAELPSAIVDLLARLVAFEPRARAGSLFALADAIDDLTRPARAASIG